MVEGAGGVSYQALYSLCGRLAPSMPGHRAAEEATFDIWNEAGLVLFYEARPAFPAGISNLDDSILVAAHLKTQTFTRGQLRDGDGSWHPRECNCRVKQSITLPAPKTKTKASSILDPFVMCK